MFKLHSDVKLVKDMTIGPLETVEANGVLKGTPNHYKRVNVVVHDLREGQCCRDIAICSSTADLKTQIRQNTSDSMKSIW